MSEPLIIHNFEAVFACKLIMHTYLKGISFVKGSLAQTTDQVNFKFYTSFWSFSYTISPNFCISSASVRKIIVSHSLNFNSYLYLENTNTTIVNVYLLNIYLYLRSHWACLLVVRVEVYV